MLHIDKTKRLDAGRLDRLFRPRSVAVVGASEKHQRSREVIKELQEADVELFLINPNRPSIFGVQAYPSLAAVGRPIDSVFVTVNALAAIDALAAAADADVGGFVVNAGGFSESKEGGEDRQARLIAAANGRPILGPNCNGFIDARRNLRISGAPHLPLKAGGLAFVSHSGALLASMGAAGYVRQCGFSHMISTGNEAMLDMADCIDFLIDDPDTKAICLAIETIRRPDAFFSAVERAQEAGKAVLAVKLGRDERAKEIASSHTGAIAGEAWIYDVALRQHGIELAYDLTEMADRAICFDQLPLSRWSALDGLAIVTASGGGAQMASDFCARMDIPLSPLESIAQDIKTLVPGTSVVNPLDMTGFVVGDQTRARQLLQLCINARDVDTLLVQWFLHEEGVEHGAAVLNALDEIAGTTDKTLMLASLEDCEPGPWTTRLSESKHVALTHGLPSTMRALQSMAAFVRRRRRDADGTARIVGPDVPRPRPEQIRISEIGPLVSFAEAMRLLGDAGFALAPFQIVEPDENAASVAVPFDGPYVVKLADVAHRTEMGAVRLKVERANLAEAIADMRRIAASHRAAETVVIQKQMRLHGEAFVGVTTDPALGPVIVSGLGGILVELMQKTVGGLAPLASADIDAMLEEMAAFGIFKSIRGAPPWNRERLFETLRATNRFVTGAAGWLESMDINPLGVSDDGFVVVDALLKVKDTAPH